MDVLELVSGEAPVADARGLSFSPAEAAAALAAAGWLAPRLDCAAADGKEALFAAFAAALGREYFASNWDAFEDSLKSLPCDEAGAAGYAFLMENYSSLPAGTAEVFEDCVKEASASILADHGRPLKALLF